MRKSIAEAEARESENEEEGEEAAAASERSEVAIGETLEDEEEEGDFRHARKLAPLIVNLS